MPGLFDPNSNSPPGGVLGALSNFFGTVAQAGSPALQESQLRQQQFQWQVQQYHQLYSAMKQRFPQMSDAEVYSRISSPGGTQELFTPKPFGEYKSGDVSGPGVALGSQVTPPSGMGFTGYQGNTGQVPQTTAPQQPAIGAQSGTSASPTIPPMAQTGINISAAKAGAEAKAKSEATALPALPEVLTESDSALQQIHNLLNHPAIENATGTFAGRNPVMTGPVKDFASRFDQLRSSALFQTILQSKADTGKAGSAGLTYAASGKLIDPYARALPTGAFKAALNELGERISNYKKNAWTAAGSPPDQQAAANSFTPKEFHYNDFNPGPGWHQNSRTGQYRDPNGNIYDSYGNPATQVK